jgi:hypothetical protein
MPVWVVPTQSISYIEESRRSIKLRVFGFGKSGREGKNEIGRLEDWLDMI